MAVAAPDQGERWDPNKAVDKLKTGVLNRFREQQEAQKRSPTRERPTKPPLTTSDDPASTEEEGAVPSSSSTAPQIKIDEGTTSS
jgi:hypothetical protein